MSEPIDKHAQRRQQSIERLQEAALKVLAVKNYSEIRVEDIPIRCAPWRFGGWSRGLGCRARM